MTDNHLDQKKLKLIFVSCSKNARFFDPVKKGMNDAAKMLDVHSSFSGTEGVDIKTQAEMVRQAVKDGYDGIALNIIDPGAFNDVVKETIEAGIPVVGFNVDDPSGTNARLSCINQQFYKAGKTLAEYLLPFIPDNSHILLTKHDEGISALEDRQNGIKDGLDKKNVRIKIIVPGNDSEKGTEVLAEILKENPDIQIIIGTGQADTEAAGRVIEKYFNRNGYWSAGFDISEKTLKLIQAGFIRCTVDQQPYIQGFYPVVQLIQYIRYGIMPSDIDAGAAIIDMSNIKKVICLAGQQYR